MTTHRHLITLALLLLPPLTVHARAGDDSGAAERLIPKLTEGDLERGCQVWVGHATRGNDPFVEVRLRLCPDPLRPGEVVGKTVWHSERSGYSLRAVRGTYDEATGAYALADTALVEEKPNPGWRFCTIDAYNLTLDDSQLNGDYVSKACSDTAMLELELEVLP